MPVEHHMTRLDAHSPFHELQRLLAHLVQEFGLRRVLAALLFEILRPVPKRPESTQILNDHLRKDVGLPPRIHPPDRWWKAPF